MNQETLKKANAILEKKEEINLGAEMIIKNASKIEEFLSKPEHEKQEDGLGQLLAPFAGILLRFKKKVTEERDILLGHLDKEFEAL